MLTPSQLTAIDQHLRKENWLLNEDLIAELTDHYMNGISECIAHGTTFDVALREIHTGFGSRKGLLAMEEEKNRNRTKSHLSIIKRELRQVISSYFQPPRLSLTLSLFGFTYWSTTKGLVNDWLWLAWTNVFFFFIPTIPLIILLLHKIYAYIVGTKQPMKSFTLLFYRCIFTINILTVLNFFCGIITVMKMEAYSTIHQTFIYFAHLLVWVIILEVTLVQPFRIKAFVN